MRCVRKKREKEQKKRKEKKGKYEEKSWKRVKQNPLKRFHTGVDKETIRSCMTPELSEKKNKKKK